LPCSFFTPFAFAIALAFKSWYSCHCAAVKVPEPAAPEDEAAADEEAAASDVEVLFGPPPVNRSTPPGTVSTSVVGG
jgi:hypothetical protein